jgi:hypothetical protein
MSRRKSLPTYERVRELLDYDPASGVLRWRIDRKRTKAGDKAGFRAVSGHFQIGIDGKTYFAHQIIWLWMTGRATEAEIDHIDGNGGNNCWCNLREADRSQNCSNSRVKVQGVLGVRGVSIERGKYRARIMKDRKSVALGYFDTPEEASAAYRRAQAILHGEFAHAD